MGAVGSTRTSPASGRRRPRMRRRTVDFPAPLEPSRTWVAPGSTARETSSRATRPPKRLVTWRRAIIARAAGPRRDDTGVVVRGEAGYAAGVIAARARREIGR